MTKYIVVVGGVISGVGKGVSTASLGKILQNFGYTATAVKIDPYINCDAGTLRPTEHGEVWVTSDGGEIDQDLGNYERFLDFNIPKFNNITTGQVYRSVIENERSGKYLGETVSVIPHIPEEVKRRVKKAAEGFDFCLIEIGGTIGDYENTPFLFAMKSLERELGKENIVYVLVTYLIIPRHIYEMKTKPTQQAIRMLSESSGIFPDFILCRGPEPLDEVRRKKIETYANIPRDRIISEPDIDTIYRIPLDLEKENLGMKILEMCKLTPRKEADWSSWEKLVNRIVAPSKKVKIAMVGKYVDIGSFALSDSYISINQALIHAGANLDVGVQIEWIDSKTLEKEESAVEVLRNYSGILIPGGFGGSGVEGKIRAIKFARENNIPFLGLCYGMQLAIVEFSRNVCSMKNANTTEVDPRTPYPVIDIIDTQKSIIEKSQYGATMRLGSYAAVLNPQSKIYSLYDAIGRLHKDEQELKFIEEWRKGVIGNGEIVAIERHRHRYEVSPRFVRLLEQGGMVFSGFHLRKDGLKLMEFIELPQHKFFVATQGHPEFKSRLNDPSPLFYGFVKACSE